MLLVSVNSVKINQVAAGCLLFACSSSYFFLVLQLLKKKNNSVSTLLSNVVNNSVLHDSVMFCFSSTCFVFADA